LSGKSSADKFDKLFRMGSSASNSPRYVRLIAGQPLNDAGRHFFQILTM
jgi:hypothetical protein